jgi:hypothetical protein
MSEIDNTVVLPEKPSDEVAQFLSNLSWGFNVHERIVDGRKVYRQLRQMLLKEQEADS